MSSASSLYRKRRLKAVRIKSTLKSTSASQTKYDQESGNIYQETTIKNIHVPDWYNRSLYSLTPRLKRIERKELLHCNRTGDPPSLFDFAKRCVAENADLLYKEALEGLEWRFGKAIWNEICKVGFDSFRLCAMFCDEFGRHPDFNPSPTTGQRARKNMLRSRQQSIRVHPDYLFEGSLIEQLSSKDNSWLVLLSFAKSSYNYTRADLFALSDLPNLAALDLSVTGSNGDVAHILDDVVTRQWVRNTTSEKCSFRRLQLLVINNFNNQSKSPWTRSFLANLCALPALKYIDLSGSKHLPMDGKLGEKYGWELHHLHRSVLHNDGYDMSNFARLEKYSKLKTSLEPFGLRDVFETLFRDDAEVEETSSNETVIMDVYLQGLNANKSQISEHVQVAKDIAKILPLMQSPDMLRLSKRDIMILERRDMGVLDSMISGAVGENQATSSQSHQEHKRIASASSLRAEPKKIKKGKGINIADLLASFS